MTSSLDRIEALAAALAATDIDSLELTGPEGRVLLRRGAAGVEPVADRQAPASRAGEAGITVASPGIGHFWRAHPLHDAPLAAEGDEVVIGQPLGLVQVGAVLVPVPAPRAGIVAAIRRADGALTGFGDPLFDILPTGAAS